MSLRFRRLSAAMAVTIAVPLGPAAAAGLKNGTYECTIGYPIRSMGNIEIDGGTYRGPAYDGKYEGRYAFEVTEGGTINWKGPLGGYSSGGNKVVATVLKDTGGGRTGFDITIQLESGNFSTVNCSPQQP